ncbi:MAG: type II toxin-antitoxin system RatA family toxin [Rhodoferax sp.]|nr:type II toxin-antitoxin system RatA family toxin [Rhodoferax sp.]
MKTVHKSVLIWYSPEEMFALVTDVALYPQFLPWCDHAAVVEVDAAGMTAEVGISFSGIRQVFITRNDHVPGRQVGMKLIKGPFSRLDGQWNFVPLGAGGERACRVDFTLNYGFDNAALATLVGPVFDKIAGSLVDAFVKRAGQVYG